MTMSHCNLAKFQCICEWVCALNALKGFLWRSDACYVEIDFVNSGYANGPTKVNNTHHFMYKL